MDADPRPDSRFDLAPRTHVSDAATLSALDALEARVLCETAEPHSHLPAWIETPPASLGLGDPEAVLRALRALDDADRARVLESLRESDARQARDRLVARLSTLADHARNGAQSLLIPLDGASPAIGAHVADALGALRALAELADREAEHARKSHPSSVAPSRGAGESPQ